MDINIFDADIENDITPIGMADDPGPWYADMWKDTGAYYQLRGRQDKDKIWRLEINFCREGIEHDGTPLEGEWWTNGTLTTLAAYKNGRPPLTTLLREFHSKVVDRIEHGYYYKALCINYAYKKSIVKAFEKRFGRNMIGELYDVS